MSTFHIEAKTGEIAETVLMPGDPLRAKFIAETYLENPVCYNRVRNMFGYTGTYKGRKISVQGSGMGMGSIAIYAHELIADYGVKQIIRVGTCGALVPHLQLGQVIIAVSASGDSSANMIKFQEGHYAASASFDLMVQAYQKANELRITTIQGDIFSTDSFYDDGPQRWDKWVSNGIICVEMESQILYTIAKKLGAKALSLLTVSDNIITGKAATPQEREQSYKDMIKIGLEIS